MSASGPGDSLPPSRVLSHLGVMAAVSAVLGVVVAGLAIPFAGVLGLGARDVSSTMEKLPAELEAGALPQKTKILDSRGKLVASLYDENRVYVPLKDISRTMVEAIVSIEDYRFYSHGAMDLKGTLRALVTNQANNGAVVQGGSSITQQLVKMTLLTQADSEEERAAATADTYERKLRELRYAIAFETKYDKDWILERYLNIAYFGDGAYGVQAAARHYFSKNASKLTLKESAMLAGLVKNPTGYDPTNDPQAARDRRNTVLARMAELNVVSEKEARAAQNQPLGLDTTAARNGCVNSSAQFFCDYVVNYLLADERLGETVEDRRKLLYNGGLTITTTLDQRFQNAADASVSDHVYATDQAIGGLAEVVPGTGEVRALAQSRPMGARKNKGETYLNYVVPKKYGDSNGFQPGSTFKAFVLAAAIRMGIPLSRTYNSPEQVFIPYSEYEDCQGNGLIGGVYDPTNSTENGTFNLYSGTQLSVNTFFAQLEADTGLCRPWRLAKKMGLNLTDPTNNMVPSFTLGVTDTDPLTMAAAYATFASRGLYCEPRPVSAIEDSNGHTLREYGNTCEQVLPGSVADAVNDVLRGVQEGSGFGATAGLALPGHPSAGKTGTTQSTKAVWFVGYTPELATASMIAGANREGQPLELIGQTIAGSYAYDASGSQTAGPMWGDAMQAIVQWLKPTDFTEPSAEDIAGVLTGVPDVSGMSQDQATSVLESAGFNAELGGYVYSGLSYGLVSYTSPGGGEEFAAGDTVYLYLSNGQPEPPPPPPPSNNGGNNGPKNNGGNNTGGNNNGGNNNGPGNGGNNGGNNGGRNGGR